MKIFPILFLFFTAHAFSQEIAVSNLKQNTLWVGLENPLKIVVENIDCDSLVITSSTGVITGQNCEYNIGIKQEGKVYISVFQKNGGDTLLLGKVEFEAQQIPEPEATVYGVESGEISAQFLKSCKGLHLNIPGFEFDLTLKVLEYSVSVFREDSLMYRETVKSSKFTHEFIQKTQFLENKDEVIFSSILVLVGDKKMRLKHGVFYRIILNN